MNKVIECIIFPPIVDFMENISALVGISANRAGSVVM